MGDRAPRLREVDARAPAARPARAPRGARRSLLDGDAVRAALVPPPGYDDAARAAFYETLGNLALALADQGLVADRRGDGASPRLPRPRAVARPPGSSRCSSTCPPEVCAARDPKGLWARARAGDAPDAPRRGRSPTSRRSRPRSSRRGGEDAARGRGGGGRCSRPRRWRGPRSRSRRRRRCPKVDAARLVDRVVVSVPAEVWTVTSFFDEVPARERRHREHEPRRARDRRGAGTRRPAARRRTAARPSWASPPASSLPLPMLVDPVAAELAEHVEPHGSREVPLEPDDRRQHLALRARRRGASPRTGGRARASRAGARPTPPRASKFPSRRSLAVLRRRRSRPRGSRPRTS